MTVGRRYAVATRLAAVKSVSPKLRGRTKRGRMVVNFATLRELLGHPQCPAKAGNCHLPFIIFSQGNATQAPCRSRSGSYMGKLLIRCPKTGQAIFTGRYVDFCDFPLNPYILQPKLLSALPRDARVVRKRRMGLRFRVFRILKPRLRNKLPSLAAHCRIGWELISVRHGPSRPRSIGLG